MALLGCLAAYVAYLHLSAKRTLDFFEAQGMTIYPSARTFFVGNAAILQQWFVLKAESKDEPIKTTFGYALDQLEPAKPRHDASSHPMVVFNQIAKASVNVSDPAVVMDLYTTKSAIVDKPGTMGIYLSKFFGDSFLFSQADEVWKAKRKAVSHAFYKDRLI